MAEKAGNPLSEIKSQLLYQLSYRGTLVKSRSRAGPGHVGTPPLSQITRQNIGGCLARRKWKETHFARPGELKPAMSGTTDSGEPDEPRELHGLPRLPLGNPTGWPERATPDRTLRGRGGTSRSVEQLSWNQKPRCIPAVARLTSIGWIPRRMFTGTWPAPHRWH